MTLHHLPFTLFLLGITIFRIAFTGWFELAPDEAYYWVWSRNLDIGYYDHPPMVAYFIALSNLLGESERFLRLTAVLSGSAATWAIYAMASDMFSSRRIGFASALLLNVAPILSVGVMIITPDTPLFLFWTLALYAGYKIVDTQKAGYWYALGLFFGLAMLSKYNAALFAPAFLAFLMFSTENRHWLFRKEPYLAFALSILVFSPVLYWNVTHDWISFQFQLSHAFESKPNQPLSYFLEFWGGQTALYGGPLFLFIFAGAFGIGWMAIRERRDDYLYLSFMSAGLLLFFLVNSARARMEGNWSVIAYLAAIAATPGVVVYCVNHMTMKSGRRLNIAYRLSVLLVAIIVVYAHIQIVDPILPMPQKREISERIYGWSMLAAEAEKKLKPLKGDTFLLANRYQISSLLTYYTQEQTEAYAAFNGRHRYEYLGTLDHLTGRNALYVTDTKRSKLAQVSKFFDRVEPAGKLRIERHGELIDEYSFFRCYNYKGGLVKI